MDKYYLSVVGIDPDKYWRYTLRELSYMSENHTFTIKLAKSLEFAVYDTSMGWKNSNQKNAFLRQKFEMLYNEEKQVLKGDEANNFLMGLQNK